MRTITGPLGIPEPGTVLRVSGGLRLRLLVATAAVVAAGAVVGVVLATGQDPPQPSAQCNTAPTAIVVPGVPTTQAAVVRRDLAKEDITAFETLARDHPKDAVVQFNYATLLFCRGYFADATTAFEHAKKVGRNTYYEVEADNLLHPQYFHPSNGPGYPIFELASPDPLLQRGIVQQRELHQHSGETIYLEAAKLHPNDVQAQVAAAVGRFNEDDIAAAFSHLGPLVTRFPHSQTVRYHLGLLLAWTGQRTEAVREFTLAVQLGPKTTMGREAAEFLKGLAGKGAKVTGK
jgi:tetratricopeptide (TPR) repeat protein